MTQDKATRLSKIAREFNVGISTIVEFLQKKKVNIDSNPNTKVTPEQYALLLEEFSTDLSVKKESERVNLRHLRERHETVSINDIDSEETEENAIEDTIATEKPVPPIFETETEKQLEKKSIGLNIIGKMDVEKPSQTKKPKEEITVEKSPEVSKKPEKPEQTEKKEEPVAKEKIKETVKTEDKKSEEIVEAEAEIEVPEEKEISNIEKKEMEVKVVGKIDLSLMNQRTRPLRKTKEQKDEERKLRLTPKNKAADKGKEEAEEITTEGSIDKAEPKSEGDKDNLLKSGVQKLNGPKVVGKMDLPEKKSASDDYHDRKKKRKRIKKDKERVVIGEEKKGAPKPAREKPKEPIKKDKKGKRQFRHEVSEEDVQRQIKDTLARLTSKGKSKGSKHRRDKREAFSQRQLEEEQLHEQEKNVLKVTEFVTVNELASMMNVAATEVIATCMSLGLFVSINQRLDAETMAIVADEFNYKVQFVSIDIQESIYEEEDSEEDLKPRPPIVTVMGHVDHGKTKLLDYVRDTNVIGGEAGGITQHIGAYGVDLKDGRKITFLDTPGHEAFTAMRARGAQITDIAIIVVAADDGVKPQTVEAINHAQAAGVPMVFAINKIDKPTANPEKVKEELANMNILVEDWGGKYQSQEVSAKSGKNIDVLLEKVLLEAELLELKANPDKKATGTVIESSLDKGRGYVTTILVEAGSLHMGDVVLAGTHSGHVKAMFNERGKRIDEAGPAIPALILGLDGAPQAGDKFNVMESDKEARDIANKREQLQREQGIRTQKHITLDEIGRRIAIGNFQELNIIVKADVDGSVEALSDSLLKLSTEEIQVNIIHKAVGQISEGDVLLAAASNAIVIGFQVRPSMQARKLAEKEEIDVRIYSIIYDAIEQIKSAMEGMLSPEIREEITATLEVREVFKITKVGTIAGCMVKEGKIKRESKVRIIREGIVVYTGELGSLKRFKDDVKEVVSGLECGLNIKNYNDLKEGDFIEGFQEFEVKKKL
ncbi:MAG: translation initiation factor IF-2 [Bacteroidales bacterium]|nr:translation initiation factor IF-2 [Bacteroidales bacterium]